jgi:transposase
MKKSYTKTQLAKQYHVSYNTFMKWIKNIPELNLSPKQRIFTPKQLEIVLRELGEP